MRESDIHERAERLVRNEVYVCLSSLVSTLAKPAYEVGQFNSNQRQGAMHELSELCEQAFEQWFGNAERLCNEFEIDPFEREIFEHWAVSDALARDLQELGERVDMDFAGMCVWGRTTTGQGIAQDSVIRDVLALHDKRYREAVGEPASDENATHERSEA